tara:strand:+ start:6948 stop:8363 length:1416 start_codon:yes stop_codon:yes gene_type:complete
MFASELWHGKAESRYAIDQSIRFNDNDSAYMHRTPSSAGNRRTFTYSFWFKLGDMATTQRMFLSVRNSDTTRDNLIFNQGSSGDYRIYLDARVSGSAHTVLEPTRALRDPSAFYHFVLTVDTTNAISSERVKMYLNGIRETTFTNETYPSLNQEFRINNTDKHSIGRFEFSSPSGYFDGYMAEIHLLDGYAYDPSYFGETTSEGIWIPKEYTGSYGTNGFKIDGRDASDLGDDESGNGNDFTANGMETNDQKADTPTNNQITFNPLNNQRSGGSPSNGNLDYVGPGSRRTIISLTANIPSTGKWAIAYKVAQVSTSSGWQIGISTANDSDFGDAVSSNEDLDLVRMQTTSSDLKINDAVNGSTIDPSLPVTTSDEFWVAVDMDSGKVFLGIYDASDTSMKFVANDAGLDGNPATGDNPTVTFDELQMPRDNVVFSVGSKQTSQYIYLQRSTDVSGTTPTGYTYFENVKDLF